VRLKLRASPVLTLFAASAHGAAASIFWFYLPQPGAACAASLTIILAILVIKDRTIFRGPSAPAWLELKRGGRLLAQRQDGQQIESQVSARRYVSRWLVVLRLAQAPVRHRTIVVARDMLSGADFRRLRLWALWDALPAADPATARAQGGR